MWRWEYRGEEQYEDRHVRCRNNRARKSYLLYLEITITPSNNQEEYEIDRKLIKENKTKGLLSKVLKAKIFSRRTKTRAYETIIKPIMHVPTHSFWISRSKDKLDQRQEKTNENKQENIWWSKKKQRRWMEKTTEVTDLYKNDKNITSF